MLRIKSFPRIHISLIGMNSDGHRLNGGIGFSIASPNLVLSFEPAECTDIIDNRNHGLSPEESRRLKKHLDEVAKKERFDIGIRCRVHDGMIRSHVGFGSNTMFYLSCVEALYILNKRKYGEDKIIAMSGRGGTSGVGINTYFKGGFVFDTGIVNYGIRPLAPSSAFISEPRQRPLLFKELKLPEWDVGICIPPVEPKTENDEVLFFQNSCPIEKEAAESILYEAVYGVTSALMEEDFEAFCKSIDAIQCTKWKSMERDLYGEKLQEVDMVIRKAGAKGVGMSSLGPMLYFFGDVVDGIVEKVKMEMPQCECFKTRFNNSCRIIEDD